MLNRDTFIDTYLDELNENIEAVDATILALKKDPENEDELTRLLRALHTIKGSSRMLKFGHIERIVHGLENVFKGVREKRYGINRPLVRLVFVTTEYLRAGADKIRSEKDDELPITNLLAVYERACANEPYSLDTLNRNHPQPESEGEFEGASAGIGESEEPSSAEPVFREAEADFETVRIKISKTDRIIKRFNNLVIKQFQFKKEMDDLRDLEIRFRELMGPSGGGNNGGSAEAARKQNECLKMIQQIRKNFSTDITLMERDALEVQEEIFSLRMLPLQLVLGRMEKMVEDMAMAMDKEIDLHITGAEVMIDKIILEKLHDPLIHLIRNAADHGIESPEDRAAQGKPRAGRIDIDCAIEGGQVIIRIRDDGKGLDYEQIRKRAVAMNPLQEEEIMEMDEASLSAYIFASGFSTNDQVRDLSGRGVGLDIVRYNIENIKGKITLNSRRGEGSEFMLTLPLSLATIEGFFVAAGGEKFLIPANFVREILILQPERILDLISRKGIKLQDKIIPIFPLTAILGRADSEPTEGKRFAVVIESLGEMVGMVVDTVIQYASLIYKPPPRSLAGLKLIQGIVFDESYNIINILHIPEVVKRFKGVRSIASRKRYSAEKSEYKNILVVDDSYSTREIERSILELENYSVVTAEDGIDGLEKLRDHHFHLIVTDINMPRMDGLTFVENLRKDDRYRKTPVIVVSSVEDPAVKADFFAKGADAYIVKSDFDRGNLIMEVRNRIGLSGEKRGGKQVVHE
ncbi:MAG: response regulator [Desulfococcaceae bacterium]